MRFPHVLTTAFCLVLLSFVANAVDVSSCQVISSSGLYELNTSLVGTLGSGSPCIDITANDVTLDCKGYTITNNGTGGVTSGIKLSGPVTGVTVKNCPLITQYYYGIHVYQSDYSVFDNNTAYNNTRGFYIQTSDYNNLTGNTAYDNVQSGFDLEGSSNNTLTGNNATENSDHGAYLHASSSDNSSDNVFTNNTLYNNSDEGIYLVTNCNDNDFINNTMAFNLNGIYSSGNLRALILDNNIFRNRDRGIYLVSTSSSDVINNTVYDNDDYGVYLNGATNNNISGNEIYDTGITAPAGNGYGIYAISVSDGNTIRDNQIYNNDGQNIGYGIYFSSSDNNIIAGNHVYDNEGGSSGYGFYIASALNNTFANNTIHSQYYGFVTNGADTTTLDNNTVYDHRFGMILTGSDTVMTGGHFYNNTDDLRVQYSVATSTLNATRLDFDNPAGNYQKYTTLSFNDSVTSGVYDISWTTNSTALPPGKNSFEEKFVDISGSGSIESIVWHWTTPEINIGEYDESTFELYKYNGAWSDTNATLSEGGNTLSLTNMNPASIYGIFGNVTPLNVTDIELYGANVTNITQHARYNGTGVAGNATTEGGNISGVNISSTQLTDKWAAFYGNVSGSVLLTGATGLNSVYSWAWAPAQGGAVCVSTNSSLSTLSAAGALGSDIDAAWNFTVSADSAVNTFNLTNCTMNIGSASIANASYVDTGPAGGFITCSLKSTKTPQKPQMLFCTNILSGGTSWNGVPADFELMVPTDSAPGATETYYFYANLG